MSPTETWALLRLRCARGLGNKRVRELLEAHGSARGVLESRAWRERPGSADASAAARVERTLRVIEQLGIRLFALHQPDYPDALRQLDNPPVLLLARGDTTLIGKMSVAVVGTRRPTEYGLSVTEQLVSGLVRAGVVVWSGMARGIDGMAHRTALEYGGATVAVLGSGIDVAYPREHGELMEQIATDGLLLSEFLPGEPPLRDHFPRRNCILAALAGGVLVVEAREDGGALITAEEAAERGTVMAVPGPINRVTSYGTNRLIQTGAKLVLEVRDILEEIGGPLNAAGERGRASARKSYHVVAPGSRMAPPPQLELGQQPHRRARYREEIVNIPPVDPLARRVWDALGEDSVHADELAAGCGLAVSAVLGILLQLEVDGRVEHVGGKRFRRARRKERREEARAGAEGNEVSEPGYTQP